MEELASEIYKNELRNTVNKCKDCNDKKPYDDCITNCTENLNVKIIELFSIKKSFLECGDNEKCKSNLINRLREVLNEYN